jgi:hypothetical protein
MSTDSARTHESGRYPSARIPTNPRQVLVAIIRRHPEADDDALLTLLKSELRDKDLTQAVEAIIAEWFRQVRSTARTAGRCLPVRPVSPAVVHPVERPLARILPFPRVKP